MASDFPADIAPFLKSEAEVLTHERAYDRLISWIIQNENHFNPMQNYTTIWGMENKKNNGQTMFILCDILEDALRDMNFSFDAVKKAWADKGLLIKDKGGYKNRQRINGKLAAVVEIKLPEADFEEADSQNIPFLSE